jgi:hypothetical protein
LLPLTVKCMLILIFLYIQSRYVKQQQNITPEKRTVLLSYWVIKWPLLLLQELLSYQVAPVVTTGVLSYQLAPVVTTGVTELSSGPCCYYRQTCEPGVSRIYRTVSAILVQYEEMLSLYRLRLTVSGAACTFTIIGLALVDGLYILLLKDIKLESVVGFEVVICTSNFLFSHETHSCCQVDLASVKGRVISQPFEYSKESKKGESCSTLLEY